MFREVTRFFLSSPVDDQNRWFTTVVTKVRRIPAEGQVNLQQHILLKGPSNAIFTHHGAVFNKDMNRFCRTVAAFKVPNDAHGIAALVTGQHHLNGVEVRPSIRFGNFHVELVGLSGMQP